MSEVDYIQCEIRFPDINRVMSTEDIVQTVTHVRGFRLSGSYVIVEIFDPHLEVWHPYTPGTRCELQYGRDGRLTDKFKFQIYSIENSTLFSRVGVRMILVEPGWFKLHTETRIKSFKDKAISEVIASLGGDAGLKVKAEETKGKATFIQPKMTSLQFISQYLLPISVSKGGQVPYLMTVDKGELLYRPPNLKQKPADKFIISSGIDTVIKKFTVTNVSSQTDFSYGTRLKTFGYDFISQGVLSHSESTNDIAQKNKLNKKPYISNSSRKLVTPYDQQWMLDAVTKNAQGRNQFTLDAKAIVDGYPDFEFDKIYRFTVPTQGAERIFEYSGDYYVYELVNVLQNRTWLSHWHLKSNAMLRDEHPGGK